MKCHARVYIRCCLTNIVTNPSGHMISNGIIETCVTQQGSACEIVRGSGALEHNTSTRFIYDKLINFVLNLHHLLLANPGSPGK